MPLYDKLGLNRHVLTAKIVFEEDSKNLSLKTVLACL